MLRRVRRESLAFACHTHDGRDNLRFDGKIFGFASSSSSSLAIESGREEMSE